MRVAAIALLAMVGAGFFCSAAEAQNYYQERNVGGRRVLVPVSGYTPVPGTYLDGSMSGSARGGQPATTPGYLPPTIHGPYVGHPGDAASRGQFSANGVPTGGMPMSAGLPACRGSAYVDGFGDHVRSDMGRNINGTVRQQRVPAAAQVIPRAPQPQEIYSYKSYGK